MMSYILIIIGIIFIFFYFIKDEQVIPKKRKKKENSICILIPARYEYNVIEDLFISIENQTRKVNKKDIYVIVEDKLDKTFSLAKNYGYNVFIRKTLRQKKGYALDECLKSIKEQYDLYFIFDADNLLDKYFIEKMEKAYMLGFDVGCAKRLNKNPDTITSYNSGWIFDLMNFANKMKSSSNDMIILSGTGFFISGKIINKIKGFPFNTLTEDYELSIYLKINNLSSIYVEDAIFYDEQPITYKSYMNQRIRWVKGYFEVRKKYRKNLLDSFLKTKKITFLKSYIGVYPIIILIIGLILLLIKNFNMAFMLKVLLILYLVLHMITIIVLKIQKQKIDYFKTLFNPLYLLSYIVCFIISILKKEVKWTRIEHTKRMIVR